MMGYGGHPFHHHPSQQRPAPHQQHPQHLLQSPSLSAGAHPQAHPQAHPSRHGNGIPGAAATAAAAASSPLLRAGHQPELSAHSPDLRKMTTPVTSAPLVGLSAAGGNFNAFPTGHFQQQQHPQGSSSTSDILSRHPTHTEGQLKDPYLSMQSLHKNINPMANFRHHPAMNPQATL